ncbi:MAG: HAD-IIB family hydrolase [Lachnospiraceae bacterium]|nr:HAD-IIB family hydrolase [Lachnospiraceae bacterium]
MIRFIVCDVEGTLQHDGENRVSEELLSQIPQLKEKGILFAVVSGKSYDELLEIFSPVKSDMLFITNNGGVVIFDDQVVFKSVIERRNALDIIKEAENTIGCNALVSGEKTTYYLAKNYDFAKYLKEVKKYHSKEVEEIYKIREDVTKISVHQNGGVSEAVFTKFAKKWGQRTEITVTDKEWIDFAAPFVNRGTAIENVQRLYEISKEDTMTFGNSYVDLEMFKYSYFSYAMQNSDTDIRKAAKHIASSVETILEDVIRM